VEILPGPAVAGPFGRPAPAEGGPPRPAGLRGYADNYRGGATWRPMIVGRSCSACVMSQISAPGVSTLPAEPAPQRASAGPERPVPVALGPRRAAAEEGVQSPQFAVTSYTEGAPLPEDRC
jgi:hypothetical protein